MNMEFYRKLPTPKELKEEFPASDKIQKIKAERDAEIRAIFEGKNDKLHIGESKKKYLYCFDDCTCKRIAICYCSLWFWGYAGNAEPQPKNSTDYVQKGC